MEEIQQYTASPVIAYFTGLKRNQKVKKYKRRRGNLACCVYVSNGYAYSTNLDLLIRERVELANQVIAFAPFSNDLPTLGSHFLAQSWDRVLAKHEGVWWEEPLELTGREIYEKAQETRKQKSQHLELAFMGFDPVFLADIFRRIPDADVKLFTPNWRVASPGNQLASHFQWDGGGALVMGWQPL